MCLFFGILSALKDGEDANRFYGWNRVDRFMAAWTQAGVSVVWHPVFTKAYSSKSAYVGYRHECACNLRGGIRKSRALVKVILCWLLRRCAAGSCEAIHSTSAWLITLRAFQARPNSPPALCRREYPLEVKLEAGCACRIKSAF